MTDNVRQGVTLHPWIMMHMGVDLRIAILDVSIQKVYAGADRDAEMDIGLLILDGLQMRQKNVARLIPSEEDLVLTSVE
jgi:hypothetical protein